MVHLILDTNIWLYLAKGQHPFVLNGLLEKVESKDVILLVNDEIVKEWDRNKGNIKLNLEKEICSLVKTAKRLELFLPESDKVAYKEFSEKVLSNQKVLVSVSEERIAKVDDLIKNQSTKIEITDASIKTAVDWALNKKAPFHKNKNSMTDALILLSAIEYVKKNTVNYKLNIPDSIFVSYNHRDFSSEDANIIHADLAPHLSSVSMSYERDWGDILDLTTMMSSQIDSYLDYLEEMAIVRTEWEAEVMEEEIITQQIREQELEDEEIMSEIIQEEDPTSTS